MNERKPELQDGDALLVVDVQNDFLPGGSLAVADGDAVVPVLNRWIAAFRARGLPVFFTRDWHPAGHSSFVSHGGPWPPHCIAGSYGADFAPGLEVPEDAEIISKAKDKDRDAYSGFEGTNLAQRLRELGVRRVFIGGLTADYCVVESVKDARAAGFEVWVLSAAVRAVDATPGDGERAFARMSGAGARFTAAATPLA
jgi:nicotinamidase/pyrazinamidase